MKAAGKQIIFILVLQCVFDAISVVNRQTTLKYLSPTENRKGHLTS